MSRQQWLTIIGIWVMVFLYLGFPDFWDKIFAIGTGLLIVIISFKVSAKNHTHSGRNHNAYVENGEKSPQ